MLSDQYYLPDQDTDSKDCFCRRTGTANSECGHARCIYHIGYPCQEEGCDANISDRDSHIQMQLDSPCCVCLCKFTNGCAGILECNHVICIECIKGLQTKYCPLCRKEITETIMTANDDALHRAYLWYNTIIRDIEAQICLPEGFEDDVRKMLCDGENYVKHIQKKYEEYSCPFMFKILKMLLKGVHRPLSKEEIQQILDELYFPPNFKSILFPLFTSIKLNAIEEIIEELSKISNNSAKCRHIIFILSDLHCGFIRIQENISKELQREKEKMTKFLEWFISQLYDGIDIDYRIAYNIDCLIRSKSTTSDTPEYWQYPKIIHKIIFSHYHAVFSEEEIMELNKCSKFLSEILLNFDEYHQSTIANTLSMMRSERYYPIILTEFGFLCDLPVGFKEDVLKLLESTKLSGTDVKSLRRKYKPTTLSKNICEMMTKYTQSHLTEDKNAILKELIMPPEFEELFYHFYRHDLPDDAYHLIQRMKDLTEDNPKCVYIVSLLEDISKGYKLIIQKNAEKRRKERVNIADFLHFYLAELDKNELSMDTQIVDNIANIIRLINIIEPDDIHQFIFTKDRLLTVDDILKLDSCCKILSDILLHDEYDFEIVASRLTGLKAKNHAKTKLDEAKQKEYDKNFPKLS